MKVLRLLPLALIFSLPRLVAADAAMATLLPLKPEVRQVMNNSCVMCHGEVIAGEKETRDDVDLSNDDSIRDTVLKAGKMKQVILEDKMPHKPRLSRRLRGNAEIQGRLDKLRADYDAKGEKAILLDWLKDVVATTGDDKKEH